MPDEPETDRAQALFVAERLLEPQFARPAIGLAELAAWLTGEGRWSGAEINRALLRHPALRADLAALRARLSRVEAPALAAASTGEVQTRRLTGGTLSLFTVAPSPLVYLDMQFDDPALVGQRLALVMVTAAGEVLRLELPPAGDEGTLMVILDPGNDEDAALLRALHAPTSSGSVIDIDGGIA